VVDFGLSSGALRSPFPEYGHFREGLNTPLDRRLQESKDSRVRGRDELFDQYEYLRNISGYGIKKPPANAIQYIIIKEERKKCPPVLLEVS
jgi:hypothetical protein